VVAAYSENTLTSRYRNHNSLYCVIPWPSPLYDFTARDAQVSSVSEILSRSRSVVCVLSVTSFTGGIIFYQTVSAYANKSMHMCFVCTESKK
jgi:hypothetical protein